MMGHRGVVWVADGIQPGEGRALTSVLASNRYRVLSPMAGIQAQGQPVRLMGFSDWLNAPLEALLPYHILVVGKLLAPTNQSLPYSIYEAVIARIRALQMQGVKVIADFCDDHFDRSQDGAYWTELARGVDVCVAGSEVMAGRIAAKSDRPVVVVGDPVRAPQGKPRVFRDDRAGFTLGRWRPFGRTSSKRLQIAWYGHPSNWVALQRWAELLARAEGLPPLMFWVISTPLPPLVAYVEQFNALHAATSKMELVPWTELDQWDLLADAEVVLIPADLGDPRKAVKTANRLIDALHSGCHVVASPIPSYQAYAPYVNLSDDPVAAFRDYLARRGEVLQAIHAGQAVVKALAGQEVIAKQWMSVFNRASEPVRIAVQANETTPSSKLIPDCAPAIRLNIGCGDKILPGYINVDVVQARAGKTPDVIADVRDLSVFDTGYADEVMAIHVVEHFWRWEVENVVSEWIRVLKPGGLLVLECPNLLSACEALLADPYRAAQSDQAGQRSMWVFYGDPQWKDPLMVHRWGYTPDSLKEMLQGLGLVDVQQAPAQFKLREPRDMRIVGRKPS